MLQFQSDHTRPHAPLFANLNTGGRRERSNCTDVKETIEAESGERANRTKRDIKDRGRRLIQAGIS